MRNRQTKCFLAALLLAGLWTALPVTAQKADPAEVLLQKAMNKQLVEGRLEEAIQLYKGILANHGGNRPVAAKALVQMGHCYEKLGKVEARKAYERVVREYPDQSQEAGEARERLAALVQPKTVADRSAMAARRVWEGPEVETNGRVSPDGRYLTYTDWETGDLAARDLATGEKRRLTNKGPWVQSTEYAEASIVSPDGKQVAYAWFNGASYDLRLQRFDGRLDREPVGPQARVLYRNPEVNYLEPGAWSPDGKYVAASARKVDNTYQILLVAVADGSARVLKTVDWRHPHMTAFSPDGRYIVYDFPPKEDSPERDLFLLATDGSREIPLAQHPAEDRVLGWSPDGKGVLFRSNRRGPMDAWILPVSDGKPQGAPELVKPDIGTIVSVGFSREGAFYYGQGTGTRDAYIATLDPKTGKSLSSPERASHRFVGVNQMPAWSLDGKYLAFLSLRGPAVEGLGAKTLVIRSLETGEERELFLKLAIGPPSMFRWFPDGRSILVLGENSKGRQGVYRVDVQTGEISPIVQSEPGARVRMAALSPDGKMLFCLRRELAADSSVIVRRELADGREKEIYRARRPSQVTHFALSPDGRQLVFRGGDYREHDVLDVLRVMPAEGGEPRDLLRAPVPKDQNITAGAGLAWTPDGDYVLFGRWRKWGPEDLNVDLWRIPAKGGVPEKLGVSMWQIQGLSIHPDGRRIAFTGGQDKGEIWVLENFLPVVKASR